MLGGGYSDFGSDIPVLRTSFRLANAARRGIILLPDTPAELGQVIDSETADWGWMVKQAGAKLE